MLSERELHSASHQFQPTRLTLARELRGLTKTELASRIEKTPSALSQLEGGQMRPEPNTLLRCALVLRVPVGFLAQPDRSPLISVEQCHFRSLRSASQRDRRRLLAYGRLVCELVGFLEKHVRFPAEQVSCVARVPASDAEIEDLAKKVRSAWGMRLGPIPAVVKLLETKGIVVCPIDGNAIKVDAFSLWHEGRPCTFLLTDKNSPSRTAWDAAHELGHLVMHPDASPGNPQAEREANVFAAGFLLPRDSFLTECPARLAWDHFWELKRRWKVSVAALLKRARDLGRLSEASYRRGFVYLNKRGYRTSEPHEPLHTSPEIVTKAMALIAPKYPLSTIADDIGFGESLLQELLAAYVGEETIP